MKFGDRVRLKGGSSEEGVVIGAMQSGTEHVETSEMLIVALHGQWPVYRWEHELEPVVAEESDLTYQRLHEAATTKMLAQPLDSPQRAYWHSIVFWLEANRDA